MVSEIVPYISNTAGLSTDVIGTFMDPIFGRTTASIYSQVLIGTTPAGIFEPAPTWTASSSLDSIVLVLKMYNTGSSLGKNNFAGQKWRLFQLANLLPQGVGYPSDTVLNTSLEISNGSVPVVFHAADSTLRLTLKASGVNQKFQKYLFDTSGVFSDVSTFNLFMRGIYIVPDSTLTSGTGELCPVNLTDTSSRLTVFYDASHSWKMVMNTPAQRVNVYNHNYTNTIAWNQAGQRGKGSDRAFVQALGGIRCVVTVPYLANLLKDNMVVINQAEFIFPKVDSSADAYNNNNPSLLLFRPRMYNGKDSLYNFTDDNAAIDYYRGKYQSPPVSSSKSYKFIMSKYIQRLLYVYRNKPALKNYGLNLYIPPDGPNTPARALLYTQFAGNKQNRPRLVITYTKLVDRK
jgi:hypothetical protein